MQMMILLVLFHSFVPDCNNYYSNMLLKMHSCFRVFKVDFNRNYFSYVKKKYILSPLRNKEYSSVNQLSLFWDACRWSCIDSYRMCHIQS